MVQLRNRVAVGSGAAKEVIEIKGDIDVEWCHNAERLMLAGTHEGTAGTARVLPVRTLLGLFSRAQKILQKENTLVELDLFELQRKPVVVVGDVHGQFHDVLEMFKVAGHPSKDQLFVFNGDFVDRGSWSVETLALLLAWKVALPRHVFLLRGNHETQHTCEKYGFQAELAAKYGPASVRADPDAAYTEKRKASEAARADLRRLIGAVTELFSHLPVSCLINRRTLVLHGGLFRKPGKYGYSSEVGTLDDLRASIKGGKEPDDHGPSALVCDLLLSDPKADRGLTESDRGAGCNFGPDITEKFLAANELSLVIRSHEGPDSRRDPDGLGSLDGGYSVDHTTKSGRLVTVFSAPDYPQWKSARSTKAGRPANRAAVLRLSVPHYDNPKVLAYDAVLLRPESEPYYELTTPLDSPPSYHDAAGLGGGHDEDDAMDEEQEQEEDGEDMGEACAPEASDETLPQFVFGRRGRFQVFMPNDMPPAMPDAGVLARLPPPPLPPARRPSAKRLLSLLGGGGGDNKRQRRDEPEAPVTRARAAAALQE